MTIDATPLSPIKVTRAFEDLRVSSPRPETPEPDSRQGRRNALAAGVQLLDDDGAISEQLELCLKHVFSKYCTPRPSTTQPTDTRIGLLEPPQNAYLSPEGLDAWAIDTNGHPFNAETKEELVEYMDVTEDGYLTQVFPHSAFNLRKELTPPRSHNPEYRILQPYSFKGFLQVYQLQTENDEEETWKDLSTHGFDRTLRLVTTRREDLDTECHNPAIVEGNPETANSS